jgi:hypothetical protein
MSLVVLRFLADFVIFSIGVLDGSSEALGCGGVAVDGVGDCGAESDMTVISSFDSGMGLSLPLVCFFETLNLGGMTMLMKYAANSVYPGTDHGYGILGPQT